MATKNELFQYSIVSALMDGVASSGLPIAHLLRRGDHGLGTFRNMRGESIIVDGRVYQMKSDGTVTTIDSSDESTTPEVTPFSMVTHFHATVRDDHTGRFASKEAMGDRISELLPGARNLFVAFRLDGVFRSVTVRTAEGQRFPGEKLSSVAGRQVTHVFEEESGTIVGFRSPAFSHGISVAGDHLHFISDDRKRGGHVLALDAENVQLLAAPMSKVQLELPSDDDEFNRAELKLDSKGIHAVEG